MVGRRTTKPDSAVPSGIISKLCKTVIISDSNPRDPIRPGTKATHIFAVGNRILGKSPKAWNQMSLMKRSNRNIL